MIEIKDMVKTYQMGDEIAVHALRGVSFGIAAGELVSIMGPSGSGKSTLMNILGCLDRPTSGSYLLDGQEVSALNDNQLAAVRNKHIGFVFQSFNLLSRASALENVELPMLYNREGGKISASERRKRAVDALTAVGLAERLNHKPNQLSGGQQQRVAIARALVNRPSIILADEPTGNLDSVSSLEIMSIFQGLNREQGITVIFVTHEPDIAAYTRRVIRMRDGHIVANEANANPLIANPAAYVESAEAQAATDAQAASPEAAETREEVAV